VRLTGRLGGLTRLCGSGEWEPRQRGGLEAHTVMGAGMRD
jgi:hypothetical protein